MDKPAVLALADGTVFRGRSVGAQGKTVGEVVFNTAMTGYQEILTDPSYAQQIVTLTYPHIGNTGTNAADAESAAVHAAGLVIRDLPLVASNFRSEQSLADYLEENGTVCIADIDTRKLTRIIREKGAQAGCILTGDLVDEALAISEAQAFPGLKGMDLAKVVTTESSYEWTEPSWQLGVTSLKAPPARFHVVALDFGVKRNILRILVDLGCRVTVMPAQSTFDEVAAQSPDGVFFSNGPGDPEPCRYAIDLAQRIMTAGVPLFGICLGHQILALASGAKTQKMSHGHHGANHPVQDLTNKTVMVTSQNHGFTVSDTDLPAHLSVTHRSLFDGTVQGICRTDVPAYSFQGHPEASPGPHDATYLFDAFLDAMTKSNAQGGAA
ncbi:MAG: glutamine-hydrolyzing carbamoyl-phosphate synthase small subunit [Luminiphilus sp.]|nr:glutamine-hydrolyzing carbamoyl-phosphate synthase small subunit [Pseudomonadales bacterium]MBL6901693.1 glutamine-hydrolyzing carbamoyl-phosphate synthase small subunit [Luminiphilus sp.]MDA0891134.1 glutamine-hydrolyzing carbamoyl-phosphate synthase small subunit [Pseudomonadota bacterium]